MAKNQTLRELMIDELRDLYDAERQLVKALPKMAKGATSDELRGLIESHLEETQEHVRRLEQAFELLEERVRGKHCAGIAGIIEEGSNLLQEDFDGAVLDAGIIAGAQRAEHYEIGAYGSVIAWAKLIGEDEVATLLHDTLEEEKAADEKLSELGEGTINQEAASASAEDEEEGMEEGEEESEGVAVGSARGNNRAASARSASSSRGGRSGSNSGSASRRR